LEKRTEIDPFAYCASTPGTGGEMSFQIEESGMFPFTIKVAV